MDAPHSPEVGEQLPVQVLLRLRPLTGQRETIVVHQGPRSIKICNPVQTTSANGEVLLVSKRLEYSFDWVLPETSSQIDTFRKSCPSMLRHFLLGGNALLFCYGPSASGKTFTILGDDKNPGILPNILRSVFASIDAAKAANSKESIPSGKTPSDVSVFPLLPGMEYTVWISYLECYNERIYDLLKTKGKEAPAPLDIKYTKAHVPIIPSNEPSVSDSQEAMHWLQMGQVNRQVGSTQINKTSSRSHTIFTIKLTQTPIGSTPEDIKADPSIVRYSKFSIVDLAGSERTTKSQATGDRLREASNINNSLLTLKRCMKALQQNQMASQQNAAGIPVLAPTVPDSAQKRLSAASRRTSTDKGLGSTASTAAGPRPMEVVPFRDSTLTKLLREFLQGEGKCSVIVNINPASAEYDESLQALDFGTITKAVKTTTCKKKIVARSASPPQPIPFSLSQLGLATGPASQTSTTAAGSRSVSRKPSQLSAATVALNLEKLAAQGSLNLSTSFHPGSLNTSLNHSLNLDRSHSEIHGAKPKPVPQRVGAAHKGPKEVEESSPSKSALNRSRLLNPSLASPGAFQVASQFRFDGMEFTGVDQGLEEEDLEVSGFDELELATEVNKLRVALLEAENRIVEAEMAVRAELAQEMANRILEMEAFYRAKNEASVRNTQDKYEKLLDHYHHAYAEEHDRVVAAMQPCEEDVDPNESAKADEEELEPRESLLERLSMKDAEIEATQTALETLEASLNELGTKYQRSQENHRRTIRELQDQHSEEVSILRAQLDALQKDIVSLKREWEALGDVRASAGENLHVLALSSSTKVSVPVDVDMDSVVETVDDVPVLPAPKKKRGRPAKKEVEQEEVLLEEEPAELEVPEPIKPAVTKKRRGKAEVVPKKRSKTSKLKEDTTPSATAEDIVLDEDLLVDEPAFEAVPVEEQVVEEEKPKRGRPKATAAKNNVALKRTKALKEILVEDKHTDVDEACEPNAMDTSTPVKAAAPPKFGAQGRRLASPSSPHIILSPGATKKTKQIEEVADEPENVPSNRLPSRTPLTKRLRSRRNNTPLLLDNDAEDYSSPVRKPAAATKRRGGAAAPRYLGQFR